MWQALLCILGLILAQDDVVFHTNVELYFRDQSRPQTLRGIIVLSDNLGFKGIPDATVRDGPWEADLVLSTFIFSSGFTRMPNYKANLEPFADSTGGDVFRVNDDNFDLNDSLQRMRQRYSLMYRALTGYKAGIPGSEARQQMSLK